MLPRPPDPVPQTPASRSRPGARFSRSEFAAQPCWEHLVRVEPLLGALETYVLELTGYQCAEQTWHGTDGQPGVADAVPHLVGPRAPAWPLQSTELAELASGHLRDQLYCRDDGSWGCRPRASAPEGDPADRAFMAAWVAAGFRRPVDGWTVTVSRWRASGVSQQSLLEMVDIAADRHRREALDNPWAYLCGIGWNQSRPEQITSPPAARPPSSSSSRHGGRGLARPDIV